MWLHYAFVCDLRIYSYLSRVITMSLISPAFLSHIPSFSPHINISLFYFPRNLIWLCALSFRKYISVILQSRSKYCILLSISISFFPRQKIMVLDALSIWNNPTAFFETCVRIKSNHITTAINSIHPFVYRTAYSIRRGDCVVLTSTT